ncbi:tRNA (adenosine(37)-N6)-threonylcarbamoyltransferase complex ATPase subunit type 1 TsaE [Spongiibacter marinus]|uniref:tRNA (adenosine(37)-N6)-threonylcarbamoyltransferase complex ATPase subunit type 1 TsaE n=1 Tax=Spongiibacter marinus TaxID=354246 RepID=UPI001960CA74|nr:tRNA (adenosine(37)-N6)-threonylcarbamoyltransferase complex ATPase subunit type 1 TsaE [Spongiibacter marinus]MBM7423518.1 tRNA threonylcarbamoyladenosine biosynthesis protein TsaE [Spongiibacter marinus]
MDIEIQLANEAETVAAGERLGRCLEMATVVYLDGDLGAGKTTFCRGVLHAYGHTGAVKSPTYTLVEPYELAAVTVYHFDLYRLGDPEELEYMGLRDYFSDDSIALIEWPERGAGVLPSPDIQVNIEQQGVGRRLVVQALSERGRRIVTQIKAL